MTYGSQAARRPTSSSSSATSPCATTTGQHLAAVDAALARLDAGTYGTCTTCGKPIGAERLEALPWAALCIDCQRAAKLAVTEPSVPTAAPASSSSAIDAIRPPPSAARHRPPHAARALRPARPQPVAQGRESLQPIGAFKIRGAYNAAASLDPADDAPGA